MARSGRRVLAVWWSNTGGTERLIAAALAGARDALASEPHPPEVLAVRCDRATPAAVRAADALLFATPECLGAVAGPMKSFFDRSYYPLLGAIEGRAYASLICAGTDGQGAARQVDRIATGWRLRRVADPVLVLTGAQTADAILAPKAIEAEALERASTLGATLAAGVAFGLW